MGPSGYKIDMLDARNSLPDDAAALKAIVVAREAEIAAHKSEIRARDLLIEKLKHQLAGMRRHRFGARSEALDQLELLLEGEEIAAAADEFKVERAVGAKLQPKRKPLPDHLPRDEQVITPGEICGRCGGKLKRLGEDVTEELEYVPGRFRVNRIVRPKLSCSCCETIHQAPLPSRPIERGRPGPGLLAHVLVSKYADHLPLYRQSQIYAREGIELERSTLADWVGKSAALLEPLADAIGRHVLAGKAIFADDTPVGVQAPGHGKVKTARLWTYVRDERPWAGPAPPAAFYRFTPDRKGKWPRNHLRDFKGFMHADGYAGFEELYRSGDTREVACMAHIRRKFFDLQASQGSAIASEALQRIARIYAIDEEARGLPPDRRREIRQAKAKAHFDDPRDLAAGPAHPHIGQVRARWGHPLRPHEDEAPALLSRSRHLGTGQQHGRTLHACHCPRKEKLSVHGLRTGRQISRNCLHLDRNGKTQRHRSTSLAYRRARPHRRPQDHASLGAHALELRSAGPSVAAVVLIDRRCSPDAFQRTALSLQLPAAGGD